MAYGLPPVAIMYGPYHGVREEGNPYVNAAMQQAIAESMAKQLGPQPGAMDPIPPTPWVAAFQAQWVEEIRQMQVRRQHDLMSRANPQVLGPPRLNLVVGPGKWRRSMKLFTASDGTVVQKGQTHRPLQPSTNQQQPVGRYRRPMKRGSSGAATSVPSFGGGCPVPRQADRRDLSFLNYTFFFCNQLFG